MTDDPTPVQGDIWWTASDGQRRPVLIVSRSIATRHLNRLVVAPVTRSVRVIPTHIPLGREQGLHVECAASFDNLRTQLKWQLTERIGRLDFPQRQIRAAVEAMADC